MAAENSTSSTHSAVGLPISRSMMAASSSVRSENSSEARFMSAARSATLVVRDQLLYADDTASRARETSDASAVG